MRPLPAALLNEPVSCDIFAPAKAKKRHLLIIFSYSYRLKNEGRQMMRGFLSGLTLVGDLL